MDTVPAPIYQTACQIRHVRYSFPSSPCPSCQHPAPRWWEAARTAVDIDLEGPVLLLITVSVHHCPACHRYFRAQPPFLRPDASYTNRVVHLAVQSVYRDGLAIRRVQQRLAADFWVRPSETMLRGWCRTFAGQVADAQDAQPWVVSSFSGILCIDEVYQGQVALLLAVDPAAPEGDRLVGYQLLQGTMTQEAVAAFLARLRAAGICPAEVITDQSVLYPRVLAAIWPQAAHQLCLFHVTRRVLRAALRALTSLRAGLPEPPAAPPRQLPGTPPVQPPRPDLRGYRLSGRDLSAAIVCSRDQARAQVHALRQQGDVEAAIARQTGFTRRTVHRWLSLPCPAVTPAVPDVCTQPAPAPLGWESWEQVAQVRALLGHARFRLLRRPDHLTEDDWSLLAPLFASPLGETLRTVRAFVTDWYALWHDAHGTRRSLADAWERVQRWRGTDAFHALPALRHFLVGFTDDQFTCLSQFLRQPAWESTNNGAERMARTFRHGQAPHYAMRTLAGIEEVLVAQTCVWHDQPVASLDQVPQQATRGRHAHQRSEAA